MVCEKLSQIQSIIRAFYSQTMTQSKQPQESEQIAAIVIPQKELDIEESLKDLVDQSKLRVPNRQNDEKSIKKKRKMLSFQQKEESQQEVKMPKRLNSKPEAIKVPIIESGNLYEQLREEYYRESERIKEEFIELQYSYWDGPNVIKKLRRKKKVLVKELLEDTRMEIIENFQGVAAIEARDLLFVIKDFIAPHDMSIADIELLSLKTSKNDLLLNLRSVKIKKQGKDLTLSINLDGPARIIQRSRYEKNKAAFPFCNWVTMTM